MIISSVFLTSSAKFRGVSMSSSGSREREDLAPADDGQLLDAAAKGASERAAKHEDRMKDLEVSF